MAEPASQRTTEQIRLHVHGTERDESAMSRLAHQLVAQARDQDGVVTYRWSRAGTEGKWLIEESYADSGSFLRHMQWMADSGNFRAVGKALKVELVIILSGDEQVVRQALGPLPQTTYELIDAL